MNFPKFSIAEAVRFGWEATKRNIGFFLILLIVVMVVEGIPSGIQKATQESAPLISALFGLLGLVVSTIVGIGVIRISLRFADNEKAELFDLYTDYRLFFRYLFAEILYGLIVAGGLILLIVPGIIWAVRFSQFGFLVVDKGVGPMEALRESARITQGARWQLFLFGLVLIGVTMLGVLALIIGLLWAVPTIFVAGAFVYRRLLAAAGGSTMPVPATALSTPATGA